MASRRFLQQKWSEQPWDNVGIRNNEGFFTVKTLPIALGFSIETLTSQIDEENGPADPPVIVADWAIICRDLMPNFRLEETSI